MTLTLFTRRLAHCIVFMASLLGLVHHAAAQQANAPEATASAAERRNVIIIYADDLGYGDLGCYGHPRFQTPNLDRLARQGARLTNFQSSCPYCAPSRASLLTGRYPFRSGMLRNPAPDANIDDVGIPDSELLLGELFQQAGYHTCCIGKWHLGHKPEYFPTRHGFDEYLGILYSNDMRPVELRKDNERFEYPVDQRTLTRRYTDRAIDFIERHEDEPFFLYLPHAMPHKPLAASDAFYQKSGSGLYGDVIAELDAEIGRLLTRLDELKLAERTLVIFTSDNGPWYGGSTGGLRGMKSQWWEGGLRVPLIARLPGVIPAGHVSHEPAIIMDVFTTALVATGLKPPLDRVIDGNDLMPLLTSDAKSRHDALFAITGGQLRAIRTERWKLHPRGTPPPDRRGDDWVDPRAPDGKTILSQAEQARPSEFPGVNRGDEAKGAALFDLKNDPAEQINVATQQPRIVEDLLRRFTAMEQQMRDAEAARTETK
ncbi:MAG: sulfatase [Pirellulaceae bacterium]